MSHNVWNRTVLLHVLQCVMQLDAPYALHPPKLISLVLLFSYNTQFVCHQPGTHTTLIPHPNYINMLC